MLVILVFADNQVQNRVVQLAEPLGASALEQAANYLNSEFAGLRLDEIRARLLRRTAGRRRRTQRAAGQRREAGLGLVRAAGRRPTWCSAGRPT